MFRYRDIKCGKLNSLNKEWFISHDREQSLVLELATDDYRLVTYHFLNNDIPKPLIDRMELHVDKKSFFDLAKLNHKKRRFKDFLDSAVQIDTSYFVSLYGFRLGDNKSRILNRLGDPIQTSVDNGIEQFDWQFHFEFGYKIQHTSMFFRKEKLIAVILYNKMWSVHSR
jgi:hypothetical protein